MIQPCKLEISIESTQFNRFLPKSMFKNVLSIELSAKSTKANMTQPILWTLREKDEEAFYMENPHTMCGDKKNMRSKTLDLKSTMGNRNT